MKKCLNCTDIKTSQWRKINKNNYCNPCWCYYNRNEHHKKIKNIYAKILISMKHDKSFHVPFNI